jgi:hypothetical protein
VPEVDQLGLFAVALPIQLCIRVGRRGVNVIPPPFTAEIDGRIAGVVVRRGAALVTRPETFQARPRLQLRAVDREVLVGEQPGGPRLREHRIEELGGDVAGQQPIPILREDRRMPDGLIHTQAHEPPKEQVVLELLDQQALRPHGVQHLDEQRPQQLLGRNRRPARVGVEPVERRREGRQGLVGQAPYRSQGMVARDSLLGREIAEEVIGLLVVATHRSHGSTTPGSCRSLRRGFVAVGTSVARRPPHRSVRAGLLHTALTLDAWRQTAGSDVSAESEHSECAGPPSGGTAPGSAAVAGSAVEARGTNARVPGSESC